jgi:hypothetical protein
MWLSQLPVGKAIRERTNGTALAPDTEWVGNVHLYPMTFATSRSPVSTLTGSLREMTETGSKVDDKDNRGRPHQDDGKQHRVGKEQPRGVASFLVLVNQVQIAKYPE